jgi:large exoprotein involved in heme utilization and adhesion
VSRPSVQSAAGAQTLSGDYYLQQLGYNPAGVTEQIGDGAYEQQLVQEQLIDLTGSPLLSGVPSKRPKRSAGVIRDCF